MAPPSLPELTLRIEALRREIAAALWLSAGMMLALLMIVLSAAGWRRAGLAAGGAYAATLLFVPVGHARWVGALGVAAALAGMCRAAGPRL